MRAIDLFCGAGGFALGMTRAGIEVIKSMDFDPPSLAVHKANLGGAPREKFGLHRIFPPARTDNSRAPLRGHLAGSRRKHAMVDLSDIIQAAPEMAALAPDLIFGGPPCQPYSKAGMQLGDADWRSSLTEAFAITVVCGRPRYFVMENVPGIKRWNAYKRSVDLFRRAGYGLTEVELDASYYGNAQRRKRWICAGCLDDGDGWLLEYLAQYEAPRQHTVADVLGPDFGALPADCRVDHQAIPPTGDHIKFRESDRKILDNTPADMRLFFFRPGGKHSPSVCRVDQPSPTITGKSAQGAGENYRPAPNDPIDLRKLPTLTFEQLSLLGGFPPNWKWDVPINRKRNPETGGPEKSTKIPKSHRAQMLGNAVAPSLAECLGRAIIDHAANIVPGVRHSKSPEAAHIEIEAADPAPFIIPKSYERWLRREKGMFGKVLSQEMSNLRRVKRYVTPRKLETASDELESLERGPPKGFQLLDSANKSTLRKTLRTFAEWDKAVRQERKKLQGLAGRREAAEDALRAQEAEQEELDRAPRKKLKLRGSAKQRGSAQDETSDREPHE